MLEKIEANNIKLLGVGDILLLKINHYQICGLDHA